MTKVAYLDCGGGISGDMMLAGLVDTGVPLDLLNTAIGSLGLPDCRVRAEEVRKNGFRATKITVDYQPEHVHRHLHQILAMIDTGRLNRHPKDLARRIFTRLAEAEAKVHGIAVEKVHFHEVGAADSIADIVGTTVGWDFLEVDRVVASPVPTGMGKIHVAHGECSIPAPATAELLRGIPLAESTIQGELTTPTGAAILATLADSFGSLPAMKIERIGYGAGHKDFADRPNILRLFVGEAVEPPVDNVNPVCLLETNLDDISGEMVGYCIERLWEHGALDVFTTAVGMKKNRPGIKLTVLCRPAETMIFEDILFRETTTLGVRRWTAERTILHRQPHSVSTPWGLVEGKIGRLQDGQFRFAPEYESCRRIAEQYGVPLHEVYQMAMKAFDAKEVASGQRPVASEDCIYF